MKGIDNYLENIDLSQRIEFERIRSIIKNAIPTVEETMSYGMPTFKYNNKVVLHFGAFKSHMSLFPGSGSVYEVMADKLDKFHVSKGTLQFTIKNPIPTPIIEEIITIQILDITSN